MNVIIIIIIIKIIITIIIIIMYVWFSVLFFARNVFRTVLRGTGLLSSLRSRIPKMSRPGNNNNNIIIISIDRPKRPEWTLTAKPHNTPNIPVPRADKTKDSRLYFIPLSHCRYELLTIYWRHVMQLMRRSNSGVLNWNGIQISEFREMRSTDSTYKVNYIF